MDPSLLELVAYQEDIEIEPTVTIPKLHLIQCDYGPFLPLEIYRVPIYIALILKNSNKCRIRLPQFYQLEFLKDILKNEEDNEEYQPLFPYFFELKSVIMDCYNVDNYSETIVLINNIRTVRYKKTHAGIKMIDARAINLNNITCFEFNEVKKFMLSVMEEAREIEN
ncbi:DNA replication complex GINS protein PSF2 [Gurleya vavrai]